MRLTLVGLGLVGQSIALSLKQVVPQIEIVGHDPDAERVKQAKARRAIDSSHWNLISACVGADIVLLDVSLHDLRLTLSALAAELSPATVVTDLLSVKAPAQALADELLGAGAPFVGGHVTSPALLGLDEPRASWLDGATYYLTSGATTTAEALDKVANLAVAVGARPQFIGAEEHDGLIASMHHLPALSDLALLHTLSQQPGARDRALASGQAMAAAAKTVSQLPEHAAEEWHANGVNIDRWLALYVASLNNLRQQLQDADAMQAITALAQEQASSLLGSQVVENREELPELNPWRSMFLGGLGRRGQGKKPKGK